MYIKSVKLKNFRNYKNLDIDFHKNVNIIYGNNAEGKTNLLESIYMCATTKSYKNTKDAEIINFGENDAHIRIDYFDEKKEKLEKIDIQLNRDIKKGIAKNGIKIKKISDYIGSFLVVLFSPEDLNIIKNGPDARRKFLNVLICEIDKIYLSNLSNYTKVLNQRNSLLKDLYVASGANKEMLFSMLDTYDDQLINYGTEIIKKRIEIINDIKIFIKDINEKITNNKESLDVSYESDILNYEKCDTITNDNIADFKSDYKKLLLSNRDNDIKNSWTKIGPQRDDIKFIVSDIDLRTYGSQGQKKTAAISLKFSELLIIYKKTKMLPILLLDDVFSELDEDRQKFLISNLKSIQTIITCTGIKKNIFELLNPNKIFKVSNGTIEEKNMN